MPSILDILNKEQIEAVEHVDGPVMVFAGAGTGKTKTLTSRVAYMVKEKDIKPYNILAITFTNKATHEMRERLEGILYEEAQLLNISTIHSLCVRILRQSGDVIGLDKHFEIIDEEDAGKLVTEILKTKFVDRMQVKPRKILKLISDYKNDVGVMTNYLKDIYAEYELKKSLNKQLDFDDLLLKVHELFTTSSETLEHYQDIYRYILVDEFQDTNRVQYEIVKLLAAKYRNIFVVGDDDQSIYSFRGATIENILNFANDYPDAYVVKLIQNYRSHDCLLKGANALIAHNNVREKKELFSNIPGSSETDLYVLQATYYDIEVNFVINEIAHLVASGKYKYSDIAILYRNNSISLKFEEKLVNQGIDYNIYGGVSFFKRKEIKDLISYFRFLIDDTKMQHFKRIIAINPQGIGDKTLDKISEIQAIERLGVFDAIDFLHATSPSTKTLQLVKFKEVLVDLKEKLNQMDLLSFFDYLMEKTGMLEKLKEDDLLDNTTRVENAMEFKSVLYMIEHDNKYLGYEKEDMIRLALDNVLLDQSIENKDKPNAVTLSTIHSIKGLEFEVVFVVALEEGIFPNFKFTEENTLELEEERRIAYVAVTRAKSRLYLTCSQERIQYGSKVRNNPSRFLKEYLEAGQITKQEKKHESTGEYYVGARVIHKFFGYGKVIGIDGDFIQIMFDNDSSIKKINKSYKFIEILDNED